MPNIREYRNKIDGIDTGPLNRAANAYGDLARSRAYAGQSIGRSIGSGIAAVGQGIQDVADKIETQNTTEELAAGQASLFGKITDFNARYNEAINSADPNTAPQVAEELITQFGDELDAQDENYTTPKAKAWWEARKSDLKQHYFEKGAADISMKAGQAVIQNLNSAAHDASLTASQDISMLPFVRDSYRATVEAMTGHLDPDQAVKIQLHVDDTLKTITKDAVIGAILHNPETMGARIEGGSYDQYFDAGEKQDLMKVVDQVKANQRNDAQAAEERQIKQNKRAVDQQLVQLQASTIDPDTGQTVLPSDYFANLTKITAMPDADFREIAAMQRAGEQILKDNMSAAMVQTDPNVYENLRNRISIDPGQPGALSRQEIAQYRADGRLSNSDYSFFMGLVGTEKADPLKKEREARLSEFLNANKSFVTKSNPFLGQLDASGDVKFLEFQQDKRQQYYTGIQEGKTPEQLLSPRSPDYIGRDIGNYQLSFKESATQRKSAKDGVMPPPPPTPSPDTAPRPGESPEAYLKRRGL